MRRHAQPQDLTPAMPEDRQSIEQPKGDGRNGVESDFKRAQILPLLKAAHRLTELTHSPREP